MAEQRCLPIELWRGRMPGKMHGILTRESPRSGPRKPIQRQRGNTAYSVPFDLPICSVPDDIPYQASLPKFVPQLIEPAHPLWVIPVPSVPRPNVHPLFWPTVSSSMYRGWYFKGQGSGLEGPYETAVGVRFLVCDKD